MTKSLRGHRIGWMSDVAITTPKRITRRKSTASTSPVLSTAFSPSTNSSKAISSVIEAFAQLIDEMKKAQQEFEKLQQEIASTRDSWRREQQAHVHEVNELNQQEEIGRRREKEAYEYELRVGRKREEDEFAARKTKWERELVERKDEIEKEQLELAQLRKQVAGFETEKEKAIKEASSLLERELKYTFEVERNLSDQENEAKIEILNLKIANLNSENTRQVKEIENLKKSLESASQQLKDIAVKVIESSNTAIKTPLPSSA